MEKENETEYGRGMVYCEKCNYWYKFGEHCDCAESIKKESSE